MIRKDCKYKDEKLNFKEHRIRLHMVVIEIEYRAVHGGANGRRVAAQRCIVPRVPRRATITVPLARNRNITEGEFVE